MGTKEFKEKVRKHFEQFTPDELSKNFEQLVRDFNKENEKPESNTLSISMGTAKFEQYKAEYQKHLNKDYADKNTVINVFKSKVNKLLKNRIEILNDIEAGKEPVILSNDIFKHYWYYTEKEWVIEILKFQRYLSEQQFEIQINKLFSESYKSPFNYDVFEQEYQIYFDEVKAKRSDLTVLNLHYEIEFFEYIKELAEIAQTGFDLKNPPPQDYIESKKIELELFEGRNPKFVFDNCFMILDFLKKQTPAEPAEPEIQNEVPEKMILINPDKIAELHSELKQYFEGSENELLTALQGFKLESRILFNGKQNQFTEVFKRLKYNRYLSSQPNDIKNWLHSNFEYHYKKGKISEVRVFNKSTVHDILTKEKNEPPRKERICQPDWLPYKTESERKKE